MCLVANLRHQHQGCRVLAQVDLLPAIGKHQLLQANFAAFAFFHPHDQRQIKPQLLKHLARHGHLALAAVYQHQIGQAAGTCWHFTGFLGLGQGFGQFAVAAKQHLAHGRVIVAGSDAFNAVTAVLGVLHFVVVKHHARSLGGFAGGVGNVKTLHPQRFQIVQRQIQRLHQGAGARLLRALFRKQAGELQVGVGLRHLQPLAALFARLVYRCHLHPRLHRQRLEQHLAHRLAHYQRGRHGHIQVVLRHKGFQHLGFDRVAGLLGRQVGTFRAFFTVEVVVAVNRSRVFHMHGEIRPVAQVAPATHHGQVDAGPTALHLDGQNVDVAV